MADEPGELAYDGPTAEEQFLVNAYFIRQGPPRAPRIYTDAVGVKLGLDVDSDGARAQMEDCVQVLIEKGYAVEETGGDDRVIVFSLAPSGVTEAEQLVREGVE